MGLNESSGNMYEWVTHTWNAIKGKCPHGCTYCFMKRWHNEDRPQPPVRFDERELRTDLGVGNFIFVGSSCDMFAEEIPVDWILQTLDHCMGFGNCYLFQSKNPRRFLAFRDYFPEASRLCTTIETNRDIREVMQYSPTPQHRAEWMRRLSGFDLYVTIEPIMIFDLDPLVELIRMVDPVQVNIGANTNHKVRLPEPSAGQVLDLIDALGEFTRVVRKRNLGRLGA